jgi:autotransporter passenger strand-loop-strand repeat protein
VLAGGTDNGAVVSSGAWLNLSSGGFASGTTVDNGGALFAYAGGVASAVTVSGAQAGLVASGGPINGAIVMGGANVTVALGGSASGTILMSGGLFVSSGTAYGSIINSGTEEALGYSYGSSNGAVDSGATVNSGGILLAYNSGTIDGATVNRGGEVELNGVTAVASGVTLEAGGFLFIFPSGGTAIGTIVDGGAYSTELEANGGTVISSIVSGNGASVVLDGGTASGTIIRSGGAEVVFSGTANAAVVSSGGTEKLVSGTVRSATILNGGTLTVSGGVESGSTITAGGQELVYGGTASGTVVSGGGTQIVYNGGIVSGAFIEADSTETLLAGALAYNVTVGDPSVQIVSSGASATGTILTSGGEQDVYGTAVDTNVGNGGVEIIYAGGTATGTTLQPGGTIDLAALSFVSGGTATWNASTGVLTVTEGGVTYTQQLTGDYASDVFELTADGNGGTDVTLCFYAGTSIATPGGEMAVELLQPGDMVCTANGARPVRWVGRSEIVTRFASKMRSLPVRITAGALGEGLPRRDLLLSPDHAIFIDGLLVQAGALVNGASIRREYDVPEIFSYYHVELESHELLLAEGVVAESFVDNVDRMNFANWADRTAPETPIAEMPYPRVKSWRQLPARFKQASAA